MRPIALAAASAFLLVSLAACGGAAAPTVPGSTQSPGSVPTQAPGGQTNPPPPVDVGSVCAGQPTYNPAAPLPSFAQDTTLNSRFPTQVEGQPVRDVQSSIWLQSMCYYGSSADEIARFIAIFPPGVAPQISTGSAEVDVNDESVDIQAFRFPGGDPNQIFSHLPEFLAAIGGDPADVANSVVTTSNVGGKNVYVITDQDGSVSYHYVSGDTIWTVDDSQEAAAAVFGAIQ